MRTAIEILADLYECTTDGEDLQMEITLNPAINILEKAINEARIEAIKECAKRATTTLDKGHIYIESAYVNTQSILQLINEVK